jgi:hypothetical protein
MPTTSSGCCVGSGEFAAEVSTVPSSRAVPGEDDDHDAPLPGLQAKLLAAYVGEVSGGGQSARANG